MRRLFLAFTALLLASRTFAASPPPARVAIIGGTFLNDALLDSGWLKESFVIPTKLGPSPQIHYGEVDGIPFYYVDKHGGGKWLETWVALHELGVREAIGGATAGGINRAMKTRDFVVPHDVIDFNTDRPKMLPPGSLRDQGFILARLTPAVDPLLHGILLEETRAVLRAERSCDAINIHDQGIVVQAAGGRFETAAEIQYFKQIGGDVVTMNVGSEMSYARQAGINYACLIIVSNPAEGIAPWGWDSLTGVYQTLNPLALAIVRRAIPRAAALPDQGRVGDGLRIHPEMTAKPKASSAP